jgi:hypothetical protein
LDHGLDLADGGGAVDVRGAVDVHGIHVHETSLRPCT